MSFRPSRRGRLLACFVALSAFVGLALAPAAGAAGRIGSTYLALGDSLAYGYQQAKFAAELPSVNPASFNTGYVDDFAAGLSFFHPGLQVVNDGCPGETTDTLLHGSGIAGYCAGGAHGTPFPYVWLHHPYAASTQIGDALAVLGAHPGASPITLDIGANDVLQFLRATCGFPATFTCSASDVAGEFAHIVGNVGSIVGQLRAADPTARIVLLGLYNPYPAVLPAPGGDALTAQLNAALASVAAAIPNVRFANPEPLFNPSGSNGGPESGDVPVICALTGMCPGGTYNPASPQADIHPTNLGYGVLAGVVGAAFATP